MDQPGIFSSLKELRPSPSVVKAPTERMKMAGLDDPNPKRTRTAGGKHLVTDPFGMILGKFGSRKKALQFASDNGGVYRGPVNMPKYVEQRYDENGDEMTGDD